MTLAGPGGTGKTRLALEAAGELVSVMSRMRRIDGDVQTSSNRAPRSSIRWAEARITPSAVESRKVTSLASRRRIAPTEASAVLERAAEGVGRVDVKLALHMDDGGGLVDLRLGECWAGRVPLHARDVTRSARSRNPLPLYASHKREAYQRATPAAATTGVVPDVCSNREWKREQKSEPGGGAQARRKRLSEAGGRR